MKRYADDAEFIRALADLLTDSDLSEIKVKRTFGEEDALEVRVARAGHVVEVQAAPAVAAPAPAAAPAAAAPAPSPAAPSPAPAGDGAAPDDLAHHPGAVTSPMVGVAYLQPEPGAPAFVQLGDTVTEGQTLVIIEAMKTMNAIPAPRAGTVRRILIDDGAPVEYGAPLVILD
ncbi:MAG: acetyl-CoA carboxylase biotin carboxyl carrier protein [Pseudomonadota bacterium]